MSITVAEFDEMITQSSQAENIANLWSRYHTQRITKIEEWTELRNYVFATDTSTTTNSSLPHKNSTTLPKLCQIRDNLHSNYLSALFPNDNWLRWESYTKEDSFKGKADAIEGYMGNKTREGHFRTEMSKLLYDYIDYGNAFVTTSFEANFADEEKTVPGYIGPKAIRISPLDIVFNPTAASFDESFKIIRSMKTVGELKAMADSEPDNAYLQEAINRHAVFHTQAGTFKWEDSEKSEAYSVDGFGNLQEYYGSGMVEFLEFWGDFHDFESGVLRRNVVVTIVDRATVIRMVDIPNWLGKAPIFHVGWRSRPDNLWAMGPLDNLVGMQYRIDHLENAKADAVDLLIQPPLKIIGEVEEFNYGPGTEIHIDENGDVQELGRGSEAVIAAESMLSILEERMEQFAGAPREAMGIRSPGEKTAFEVNQLQNASGRIFQEKINTFEIEILEPCLNSMLETSRRQGEINDVVRVMDDDLGVAKYLEVSKSDITASGKLRPIGARHFAAQAQLLQNLQQLIGGPIGQLIAPHLSSKALAALVEDVIGLDKFALIRPNIAVFEQQETQRLINQAGEDLEVEQATPTPEELA